MRSRPTSPNTRHGAWRAGAPTAAATGARRRVATAVNRRKARKRELGSEPDFERRLGGRDGQSRLLERASAESRFLADVHRGIADLIESAGSHATTTPDDVDIGHVVRLYARKRRFSEEIAWAIIKRELDLPFAVDEQEI